MDCTHHWTIETPNGDRMVAGECRRCGARREFEAAGPMITAKEAVGRTFEVLSEAGLR